ncbi:hypothetical protein Igag_0771 [Ignisphaera aggregans DSM 17230]|uniref:Uncharacterized protein n=1 Tax=Ignisphaera aggregans (strain DSM 17230 / JCM 13409 / AQ1.S1) TaxID=583356 RepID=E0STC1_IGNAA|nr:hypothetical protein Igag_0771 [Ignisphaera aggregans DSM 17230]
MGLTNEVSQDLEKSRMELHKKELEAAMRMSEEEKKLIRDLIESSYRMVYLGYIPAYYRARPNRITSLYIM